MAKVHDRILEVTGIADLSDTTLAVSAVKYYRDRGELAAANGYALSYSPSTAQVIPNAEIAFGELVPPPTHLRFAITVQA